MQLSGFKSQLKQIEDKILKLVSDATDDILNDEELIMTLDQSKKTSTQINQKMIEAEKTAVVINESRESYRSVARRGSVLYFVIADLANINEMYQYSLEYFQKLFNRRIEKSEKSEQLEERLAILISDITESFYVNICRGLFERDKLLYSFLNATSILRRSADIGVDEWNCFLRGSPTDFSAERNTCSFLNDATFHKLLALEECHPAFKDISKSFCDSTDETIWKQIYESEEPANVPLPPQFDDRLSPF